MKPIILTKGPRFDTRGLPEGYDPHQLYEYRLQKRIKEATGLEGYIFQYIPISLIKSFAIAFDPLSGVKTSLGVVTPANRMRYRATTSVLDIRRVRRYNRTTTFASMVNYQGIGGKDGPVRDTSSPAVPDTFIALNKQLALPNTSKDTTRRTRLFGSDTGELEQCSGYVVSSSRSVQQLASNYHDFTLNVSNSNPYPSIQGGVQTIRDTFEPSAATLSPTTHSNLVSHEKDVALALMQAHCLPMFKDCNPQSRNYSFFRNLVELRDLPRSILQLKDTIENLRKLDTSLKMSKDIRQIVCNLKSSVKDIPNGYLSYHFGWKQTYKDVMDLMVKPAQIAKQINLLIERNGKPTTFRTKRSYVTAESGVSGFDYNNSSLEESVLTASRIERTTELRMVLNTTFSFPVVDIPKLRYDLFTDKLGIYPRFIDIYNLVPWTWLFDWFTGFGNYLEIIENIHHDPSLINWAFITSVTDGKLVTDLTSKSRSSDDLYHNYHAGDPHTTSYSYMANQHSSNYFYKLQLRRDLSTILDVKSTAKPESLSLYQQSILGALLSQRSDFKRSRHIGG